MADDRDEPQDETSDEAKADGASRDDGHAPKTPLIIDDVPSKDEKTPDPSIRVDSASSEGRDIGGSADDLRIVEHEEHRRSIGSSEQGEVSESSKSSGEMILTPEGLLPRVDRDVERGRGSTTLRVGTTGPIKEVEALLSAGRWRQIREDLGEPDDVVALPAALRVIYGIACKESADVGIPTSDSDRLTILAVAELFGVSDDSPIALIVAKRALRSKRPWAKREAPRGPLSILLLALGLGLGGLVGWLVTFYL